MVEISIQLKSVLDLAKLGFKIIPLYTRSKIPRLNEWQKKCSSDPGTIAGWVQPGGNWGVVTGKTSGVFVVDIDQKNGGLKKWDDLIGKNGDLPATVTALTGSGGLHLYFKYPSDRVINNRVGLAGGGIDVRGENGQVLVPPSTHPNGNPYTWLHDPSVTTLQDAPEWLLNLISQDTASSSFPDIGGPLERGTRNDTIFHQALALSKAGATVDFAVSTMVAWCIATGNSDMNNSEIEATVRSAFKRAETTAKSSADHLATSRQVFDIGKTDYDNGQKILERHGENLRYTSGLGWFIWDGRVWKPDDDNAIIINLAVETMRDMRDHALDDAKDPAGFKAAFAKASWATICLNLAKIHAMIEMASKDSRVRVLVDDMDPTESKFTLNCKNGEVDLRTGVIIPHEKGAMLTRIIEHDYDPNAECPMWIRTLELAFDGNQSLIEFTQRAIGYSLTGSTAEQCMFICWGESGNNGKSTILEGLQRLLGRGYCQMSDMKVITSQDMDNRVASSLAKLQGVRLVSMNEAEENQKLSENLVKQLTGGDTLQACKKYQEPFEFTPVFKLWIRTNDKPIIRGINEAIWRRIKLIPFLKPIPPEFRKSRDEVDKTLDEEAEGILAWCVRGAIKWFSDGLKDPTEVTEAVNDYRTEMDVVSSFMDENVVFNETAHILRQDLYKSFTNWSRMNGYKYVMTSRSFGKRVGHRLNQQGREMLDGQYVWRGIDLHDSAKYELSVS